jgi:heterodisulfide reductase subunit A
MPGMDTAKMSEMLNIPVNQDGFLGADDLDAGVFVAGTAAGPGSIAATIAGAGNVALATMNYLGGSK